MTTRLSNTIVRATVALLAAGVLAGGALACGGSSGPSAQSLVNDTFSSRAHIESGQVDLALTLAPTGSGSSSSKSLSLRLTGPFQNAGAGKLPHFSLKLSLNAAGHAIQAGATATGSQFFVQLAGTWFVAPEATYKAIEQGYAQATKAASSSQSSFASLGIEPRSWLSNPTNAGAATVGGVNTYHVSSDVNTAAFLQDVSKLSQSAGSLGTTVPGVGSLTPSAVSELGKAIHSAHVDIYTGKSDHLLRRLDLSAALSSTPQTQSLLGGASSAQIGFHLQLAALNESQTISAPSKPRPFSELLPALQQLLGTLQGAAGSSSSLGG